MQFQTLHTERLILRKINPEALAYIHDQLSRAEAMEALGLGSIDELEKEEDKFRKGFAIYKNSYCYFQLIEKTSQTIIGWCGYHTWYIDHKRAEIGYGLFDEQYKKKGLMSEALIPILDYGFSEMGLNRVEAFVAPDNIPSLKLIQKFNFVKEGLLREHYSFNGNLEDSVVFSLLKREWEKG